MPKTIKEKIETLKLICDHLEELASDEDLCDDEYFLLEEITGLEKSDWDSNELAHFIDGMQLVFNKKEQEVQELKDIIEKQKKIINNQQDGYYNEIKIERKKNELKILEIEKLQKENEELKELIKKKNHQIRRGYKYNQVLINKTKRVD